MLLLRKLRWAKGLVDVIQLVSGGTQVCLF